MFLKSNTVAQVGHGLFYQQEQPYHSLISLSTVLHVHSGVGVGEQEYSWASNVRRSSGERWTVLVQQPPPPLGPYRPSRQRACVQRQQVLLTTILNAHQQMCKRGRLKKDMERKYFLKPWYTWIHSLYPFWRPIFRWNEPLKQSS